MKNKWLFIIAGIFLAGLVGCSSGDSSSQNSTTTLGTSSNTGINAGTNSGAAKTPYVYADDYATCKVEDTYNEGQTPCYVDSVNGRDANNGLSEAFPVKSQSAINPRCTVVRFKRGSVFNEKLAIPTFFNTINFGYNVKVYTNYGPDTDPLPHFIVPSLPGRGPVVLSFSPLIIDGLHFSGARGDNTMVHDFDSDRDGITKGIVGGIGAFLGAATTFINNEIDDCDIGLMLGAQGSIVRGNYVHDLNMGIDDAPGVDPNLVGGAEGIFINASNCEVSYNSFVNCTGPARWVGNHGTCDGGATEISAASGGTIENVRVHHNFSYNSCGFLEIATYFGDQGKGLFKDSSFHNNVIVDSAWMGLLQVNNTDLDNIHFYNNTLIQHPGSPNAGILWIIFTDTSSGMQGGSLVPGTVHLTNNLYVLDGVTSYLRLIDPAFDSHNNILASYSGHQDPNYVDLGFANISGKTAADFNLVTPNSPAIDAGIDIAGNVLDYFNRARPNGKAPDIGSMEFGSAQVQCLPRFPTISNLPISTLVRSSLASGPHTISNQMPIALPRNQGKDRFMAASPRHAVMVSTANPDVLHLSNIDSDGDGVMDAIDQCPNSILRPTISVDGCDSGVMNPISTTGCTLSDDLQLLANGATSRRQFTERAAPYLSKLLNNGAITKSQRDAIGHCISAPVANQSVPFTVNLQ